VKDFVYILGDGSRNEDFEIKYSLMSVARFVSNVRRIYVVGDIPRRTSDVEFSHLQAQDLTGDKSANVRAKLQKFCSHKSALNDFVLMNDDFFFCRPVDADKITPTASGTLEMHIASRAGQNTRYSGALKQTLETLREMGYKTRDYETHVPLPMSRDRFLRLIENVDWSVSPCPLFRSMYGNLFDLPAERLSDLKLSEPLTEAEIKRRIGDRAFFSIGDGALSAGSEMNKFLHHICTSKSYNPTTL